MKKTPTVTGEERIRIWLTLHCTVEESAVLKAKLIDFEEANTFVKFSKSILFLNRPKIIINIQQNCAVSQFELFQIIKAKTAKNTIPNDKLLNGE